MRVMPDTCKFIVFSIVIAGLNWYRIYKCLKIKTLSKDCKLYESGGWSSLKFYEVHGSGDHEVKSRLCFPN